MKKKIKESASDGSTSAGAIASVPTGLHFEMQRRLPKSNLFGYYDYEEEKAKKRKEEN